jgi:DNA-binding CsgD family transcriptional regulator
VHFIFYTTDIRIALSFNLQCDRMRGDGFMAQPSKHPFHAGPDAGIGDTARPPSLRMVEMPPRPDGTAPSLTRRESECLAWCAEGKSYWETAIILGIAERTVSFHMESARAKLNAGSNAHAVAIAVHAGLLELGSGKVAAPQRGLR